MKKELITPKVLKAIAIYRNAKTNAITIVLKVRFIAAVMVTSLLNLAHAQQYNGKYFNNADGNGVIPGGCDALAQVRVYTTKNPVT